MTKKSAGDFLGKLRPQALVLLFVGLLVGALSVLNASPAAADPATLAVSPASTTTTVSSNFTTNITVTLGSGESINAADIYITFNNSLIEFVSSSNGPTLPTDFSPGTPNSHCSNDTDSCTYRAVRTGSSVSGPGTFTLFSITWHAIAPGSDSAAINILDTSQLANNGQSVAIIGITDGSVTVNLAGPTIDLTISKADSPDPVSNGGTLTYTLTSNASGTGTASNYFIDDVIPAGVTVTAASPSEGDCDQISPGFSETPPWTGPATIRCGPFSTPASSSDSVTISSTVTATGPTTLTNTANTDSTGVVSESNEGNNTASATTTVSGPPGQASLFVDPSSQTRSISNTFATEIEVANVTNLSGADITVTYNPSLIDTVSITNGAIMNSVITASCSGGACAYQAVRTGAPFSGSGVLFTINAHATAAGSFTFDITSSQLSNNVGDPISHTVSDGTVTIVGNPDLTLAKSDSPDPVISGSTLNYTLTSTNIGAGTATGYFIDDVIPAGVTVTAASPSEGDCDQISPGFSETPPWTGPATIRCGPFTTAASSSDSVTISSTVTATGPTTLTNTANTDSTGVVSESNEGNNTDTESTQVNPPAQADLTLSKQDTPDPVVSGSTLNYTLTSTNIGAGTATGYFIDDVIPAGVTVTAASPSEGDCDQISPGFSETPPWTGPATIRCGPFTTGPSGSDTVSITATVTAAGGSTLTNTANTDSTGVVSESNEGNNTDTESTAVTTVPQADLSITKVGSASSVPSGGALTYTITSTNSGSGTATGYFINDVIPAGVTVTSASSSEGDCDQISPGFSETPPWTGPATIQCGPFTTGPSGGVDTVTITATVTAAPGSVTNTATTDATGAVSETNEANNTASLTTTVTTPLLAELSAVKTSTPSTVPSGGTVTYTITATNSGSATATGYFIDDVIPAGVTVTAATPSEGDCDQTSPGFSETPPWTGPATIRCGPFTTVPSATETITLTATITAGPGAITNSVTVDVTGVVTEGNEANQTTTVVTTVTEGADLALTKTGTPTAINTGESVTFTLTATNIGTATATGYFIDDFIPAGVTVTAATPSEGDCDQTSPGFSETPPWTGPATIRCGPFTTAAGGVDTVSITATMTASGATTVTVLNGARADSTNVVPETNEDADDPELDCTNLGEGSDASPATEPDNYDCVATSVTPTQFIPVPLVPGWNLVQWEPNNCKDMVQALNNLLAPADVHGVTGLWIAEGQFFLLFDDDAPVALNTLDELCSEDIIWIYVIVEIIWLQDP